MPDPAIHVDRVTKRFKLYHDPVTGPVKELLLFWRRRDFYREHLAVKDVSLTLRRGEVVGVIGPNGAGKTTLLKMIAGLLPVDGGAITVQGKVTALLALGVGSNMEFSGRENILHGGMLLGMRKREVLRKMDDIIAFSELGEQIERPLRTYSAGMRARLLFSISMSIDPDILIIDEALATGDAHFVGKCVRRIHEIVRGGATILFVSHNMAQVQELCERAVLMAGGKVVAQGPCGETVAAYNRLVHEIESSKAAASEPTGLAPVGGSGTVRLTALELLGPDGRPAASLHTGEPATLRMRYVADPAAAGREAYLAVGFQAIPGHQYVAEVDSRFLVHERETCEHVALLRRGVIELAFPQMLLLNGRYSLWVWIIATDGEKLCEYKDVGNFFIARRSNPGPRGPFISHPCVIHAGPDPIPGPHSAAGGPGSQNPAPISESTDIRVLE